MIYVPKYAEQKKLELYSIELIDIYICIGSNRNVIKILFR